MTFNILSAAVLDQYDFFSSPYFTLVHSIKPIEKKKKKAHQGSKSYTEFCLIPDRWTFKIMLSQWLPLTTEEYTGK